MPLVDEVTETPPAPPVPLTELLLWALAVVVLLVVVDELVVVLEQAPAPHAVKPTAASKRMSKVLDMVFILLDVAYLMLHAMQQRSAPHRFFSYEDCARASP